MKPTINQQQIETNRKDLKLFNILYVDEDDSSSQTFSDSFNRDFNVYLAQSETKALEIIVENDIHLLVSNIHVKDSNGIELLRKVHSQKPDIVRVLTGDADLDTLTKAVNEAKIEKFIPQHWEIDDVKIAIEEELQFQMTDKYDLVELPKISFRSRIGNEELDTLGEAGQQISKVFPKSFEIINYPEKCQSNFQWVGDCIQGHKVVLLLNTVLHPNKDEQINTALSESIASIMNEYGACSQAIIGKVASCYESIASEYGLILKEDFDLSICAMFIDNKNDTIQYFSNYHGVKLFDLSLNEYEDEMYSGFYRLSAVSRIFIFSSSFNAHCLGELTYSELINESIEMDLERQGHFLEMEVINSHLTTFNVSIIGIELNNYLHQKAS